MRIVGPLSGLRRPNAALSAAPAPSSSGGLRASARLRPWRSCATSSRTLCRSCMPSSRCAISRPRKRSVSLTLSPSSKNRLHRPHLHLVVVGVDVGAHLDLLDLDDLLVLARFGRLFLVGVFQLAQIEDLAHRRIGVRGNLHEVEAGLFGEQQCVVDGNVAAVVAVGIDELDAGNPDVAVGARAVFCRRGRFEWSANGRRSPRAVDDSGFVRARPQPMSLRAKPKSIAQREQ